MSLNAHAFVEGDYRETLYRAAERLSDEELDERITLYEETDERNRERYKNRWTSKLYQWIMENPWGPRAALEIPFVFAIGFPEIVYDKFTEGTKPLILDNINPLVGSEVAYKVAIQERNTRKRKSI
ncbi:MAG: hypothetical protein KKC19_03930 [Nanoarchaeota archaeon]|nr:hypothetical protein [Nanoarchaeota archaeon]